MYLATNPAPGFKSRPEHKITIEPFRGRVVVVFRDTVLASSEDALVLREASYPAVYYLPFKDVDFGSLRSSDSESYCPFKGRASYWNATAGGETAADAMWAYRHPYDEVAAIADHGAFYPSKVRIEAMPEG